MRWGREDNIRSQAVETKDGNKVRTCRAAAARVPAEAQRVHRSGDEVQELQLVEGVADRQVHELEASYMQKQRYIDTLKYALEPRSVDQGCFHQ